MPGYFESGVFTENRPAWHGAGVVVQDEYLTLDRVFELAPLLASPVVKADLFATWATGNEADPIGVAETDRFFGCVRQCDGKMLGAGLGANYTVFQNRQLFELAEAIVEQGGLWKTAGSLREGSVVWGMLEIPELAKMVGEDYQRNLFVTNSFDGSTGIRVATCTTRIVCANTLAVADREARRSFSARHVGEHVAWDAKAALQLAYDHHAHVAAIAEQLAAVKLTKLAGTKLLARLVPYTPESEASDIVKRNIDARRADLAHVWLKSPNLETIRMTAWGLVHAVTEFEQHYAYTDRTPQQKLRAVVADNDLPLTKAAMQLALA